MAFKILIPLCLVFLHCICAFADENGDLLMQNEKYFEGDIEMSAEERKMIALQKLGVPTFALTRAQLWPNPTSIPYEIDHTLQNSQRALTAIADGLKEIEDKTCLRFRKRRSGERHYLRYTDGSGCFSPVGYSSRRSSYNRIQLASGCRIKGIAIHETMHSLGFWHEQSRPDRDQYVTVVYSNIIRKWAYAFDKYSKTTIDSRGSPYDYDSIMHYGSNYFAIDRSKPTIRTKYAKDQGRLGQRRGMSRQDIEQINKAYCNRRG